MGFFPMAHHPRYENMMANWRSMSLHMIGPGKQSPEIVNAVVEIPYGSRIKYEIDHVTSLVKVDRVLYSPSTTRPSTASSPTPWPRTVTPATSWC